MFTFLFFSLLSGVLELGIVLKSYAQGMPVCMALVMGAMYQMGNLLFTLKPPGRPTFIRMGLAGLALEIPGLLCGNIMIEVIQIVLLSVCIQTIRAEHKTACPTSLKRIFRIGGFLLSPFMLVFPRGLSVLCMALCLAAVMRRSDIVCQEEIVEKNRKRRISMTMVLHQMHYFVYTYIMPLTVMELTGNGFLAVFIFALTWGVYLVPGLLAEKRNAYDPKVVFVVCHLFLAVIMGMLSLAFMTGNIKAGLVLWLLTGLGGGSVFCIDQFVPEDRKDDMALSENIGHFFGALLAVAVSLAIGDGLSAALTGLSCLFVCMTLLSAGFDIKEERWGKQWKNRTE